MSRNMAAGLHSLVLVSTAWMRQGRRAMTCALLAERLEQTLLLATAAGPICIVCPSARALHDPFGFGRDEPETVAWLDSLPAGDRLWDIGANIGVYSLYAAARGLAVIAFEPSAASFAALTRNIEANGWDRRIAAYCLALDRSEALGELHMAATAAGHSMHSLDGAPTIEGAVRTTFRQAIPGFSLDGFRRLFGAPPPQHIKLDVDGLESAILAGAADTLREVETVMVEIAGAARAAGGESIRGLLTDAGLLEVVAEAGARNVLFRRAR